VPRKPETGGFVVTALLLPHAVSAPDSHREKWLWRLLRMHLK